ncbi:MAG TPA: polysaccharide deacetylase family protein [Candidatus Sulfotelmatobacter sp.]|nr:polysaccharide deacetylase family protein [Candidatus Sulfotelmatobacter sp.]
MARILMYHNFTHRNDANTDAVSIDSARRQLAYLTRTFQVVSLTHLVEQLQTRNRLDSRMAVLTVDDGRRNFYECFFPLLQEFQIPATFFVVSSFIRQEDWIWTDKVLWLAEQGDPVEEVRPDRIEHFFSKMNRLRPEERNACIDSVAKCMNVSIPREAPSRYAPCSWAELRQMADSGLVEIGSHSVNHPIFSSLTDEESWCELTTSRAHIEMGLGRKINSFCFPNGKPADYFARHLEQVQRAGYSSAVMTHFGMVRQNSDPFSLARMGVSGSSDFISFRKYVDGIEYYQSKLRKRL